ncbi:MAG: O-antigen ligase domain-containing protein [Flavobacteriales bacterium TMED235]|nr:MAG: O-antigen ligase domain-containing protein [Flavobacteriales bacterium TMED235]|tara:strand:- start:2096 stop:3382 length:1287 start_codon:yes stop_codon:yes gene_type:complete
MMTQKNLNSITSFLFYLLPAALVTGPFLSDLIITLMGIFFLFFSIKNKQWFYYKNIFSKFFFSFYIYLIISSIWADNTIESLKSSVPYIRFLLFSLAIVYLSKVNKKIYYSFFKISLLTISLVIFDALIQFIFGSNLFGHSIYYLKDSYTSAITLRTSGIFGDELILGSYLSRLILIIIGLYFFCENKINNLLFIIFIIAALIVIFISGERLAFFLVLFCFFYLFIQLKNFRKKIIVISLFVFSLIFILVTMNQGIKNRMVVSTLAFLENDENSSYTNKENFMIFSPDHHELYIAAYKMFLEKPLLGHGHNMYEENCGKFKRSVSSCSTHPHNTLIQITTENGVFGLLFLLLVYTYLIKLFISNIKIYDKNQKNHSYLFQICLLSIITANIFPLVPSGNFFNNWLSILYYLPIGFYLSIALVKSSKYE